MSSERKLSARDYGLDPSRLPRHVAVIMDGNGRWARKRLLNRTIGHERGADTVRTVVRTSREAGVGYLTLYAFSTENWRRPKAEVSALMMLLKRFLKSERSEMLDNGIRLSVIGQFDRLPQDVREAASEVMAATASNDRMVLTLALSYGGREEILRAVRLVAEDVRAGRLDPASVNEEEIGRRLYTADMPDPDLLIRTSGEMRVSNFLLWQIAYAEIFITKTLWPDFSKEEYINILKEFGTRERRFGQTGEQLDPP